MNSIMIRPIHGVPTACYASTVLPTVTEVFQGVGDCLGSLAAHINVGDQNSYLMEYNRIIASLPKRTQPLSEAEQRLWPDIGRWYKEFRSFSKKYLDGHMSNRQAQQEFDILWMQFPFSEEEIIVIDLDDDDSIEVTDSDEFDAAIDDSFNEIIEKK